MYIMESCIDHGSRLIIKSVFLFLLSFFAIVPAVLSETPGGDNGREALLEEAKKCLKTVADGEGGREALASARETFSGIYEKLSRIDDSSAEDLREYYDSYRQTGKAEEAVRLITFLIPFTDRAYYYLDRGNIYLNDLNIPALALGDFEKVIELDPGHTTVYTDLGMAYEALGEIDKALAAYRTAEERDPLDIWVQTGIMRARGILLARDGEVIKDWYFAGPFPNDSVHPYGAEKAIITELDTSRVYFSDEGREYSWIRPYGRDSYGYVNLGEVFPKGNTSRSYALTYIFSPSDRNVLFKAGSDDGITVWVNSVKVWDNPLRRSPVLDDDVFGVRLNEGWNTVLLRVTQDWGGWGFYFRVTDSDDNTANDLIFDPERDEEKVLPVIRALERERRLAGIRYGFMGGGFLLAVILSLLFLVANVRNSLKIKRMRDDFTSSVTHDLKIPLSSIMASAEMLKDGTVSGQKKVDEYLDVISREAARLGNYIDRILEVSRNRRPKPYMPALVDVPAVVHRAVEEYRLDNAETRIEVSVGVSGGVHNAYADAHALVQAMMNLLSNAEKYSTDDKRVEITIGRKGQDVYVSVKDHGIGISPRAVRKIFTKFYREDSEFVRSKPGTGLGLAFVKSVIEAHNGRITVSSRPGEGSEFIITLPAEA